MNVRTLGRVSLLGLAFLAWACDSGPVAPPPVEGVYQAVSAAGQSLPAFINPDGSVGSGRQLMHASLALHAPNSLQLVVTTRVVDASGNPDAAVSDTLYADYRVEGSLLLLSPTEAHPLRLSEQGSIRSDGSLVLTLRQPLPPSQGLGTYPVEILFQR